MQRPIYLIKRTIFKSEADMDVILDLNLAGDA